MKMHGQGAKGGNFNRILKNMQFAFVNGKLTFC